MIRILKKMQTSLQA